MLVIVRTVSEIVSEIFLLQQGKDGGRSGAYTVGPAISYIGLVASQLGAI